MFRTFTTIVVLALTVSAAQAGDLNSRIHDAAVKACAPEAVQGGTPVSHYGAIMQTCIDRLSNSAMNKYQAEARAKAAREMAGN